MKLVTIVILLISFTVVSQNVKGTVVDETTRKPLEDVNVYYKKESKGTITNKKGKFTLNIKSKRAKKDSLYFSILGYETKKYSILQLKKNKTIGLKPKLEKLSEVTVLSNKKLKSKIQYKELTSMKRGLHSFSYELVKDKIYLIGGDASLTEDGARRAAEKFANAEIISIPEYIRELTRTSWENYKENLYIYDIKQDVWKKSPLKFRKRAYHNMNYIDDKFYILGGKRLAYSRNFEYLDDKIEVYNLKTKTIKIDKTNPHQAVNFQSFVYNKSIIVLGGSTKLKKNGSIISSKKMHVYDLQSGLWYELDDMLEAKEVKGVLIKNKIYLIGGFNNKALATIESYDLISGKWENEGSLFTAIERPALTFNEDIIYIYDERRLLTYNINTKVLNKYKININLKGAALFYHKNQLYLFGGYEEDEYEKQPSSKIYTIKLEEFDKTKILDSKIVISKSTLN